MCKKAEGEIRMTAQGTSFLTGLHCVATRSVTVAHRDSQQSGMVPDQCGSGARLLAGQQHISMAWLTVKALVPIEHRCSQPLMFCVTAG